MKNRLRQLMLIVPLFWTGAAAAEEFDLNYYQNIFESDSRSEQKRAAASLAWAGLSDPAIFDLVEQRLKRSDDSSSAGLDYRAWLLKALGFSGNEKYSVTLEAFTKSGNPGKLRKYAKQAQGTMVNYARWNPQINDRAGFTEGQSLQYNRFVNMLRSDYLELKRIAAKRIHHQHLYDPFLLEELSAQLKAGVPSMGRDRLTIDTYAWMAKALAGSGEPQYKPQIEEISKSAPQSKMRNYAKRYLNYF